LKKGEELERKVEEEEGKRREEEGRARIGGFGGRTKKEYETLRTTWKNLFSIRIYVHIMHLHIRALSVCICVHILHIYKSMYEYMRRGI